MKKSSLYRVLLSLLVVSSAASKADGLFSAKDNSLFVPFVNYQGQTYQANFSILDSNKLQLNSALPRDDQPIYGSATLVDDNLNFNMQRISFEGQLYNAKVTFQQDNIFLLENIALADENLSSRGNIVDATLVNEVSQAEFDFSISAYNFQNGTNLNLQATNDVQIYSVRYETIDPAGQLTEASALVAFPTNVDKNYPLIAYQHGTEVLRDNAPSQKPNHMSTLALAATGYAVVSADYLGLGESNSLHPYVHAHSLATAVIDALRTAKTLSSDKGVNLSGQLFLIGYSEGGYATMVTHRELQRNYADEFTVTASAPMAGPYDLSGAMVERFFDDSPHPNPYYFPYTVLAYDQVYGFNDTLSDIFQAPYDQTISGLFDGTHTSSEINDSIAENRELFNQELYDQLGEGQISWRKAALTENDSYRWTPNSAMYLFHCTQDDQVPYQNTQVAFDYFQSIGATQVQLFAIDDASLNQSNVHSNCAIPLLLEGKSLFDALIE